MVLGLLELLKMKKLDFYGLLFEGVGEFFIIVAAIIAAILYQNNGFTWGNVVGIILILMFGIWVRYKGQEQHR